MRALMYIQKVWNEEKDIVLHSLTIGLITSVIIMIVVSSILILLVSVFRILTWDY